MSHSRTPMFDEESRRHGAPWLLLATAAVAASGFFAILIALARVPAIGQLFPGAEFYRVALTLHVNLSQGVWFMAFAAALWSLNTSRRPAMVDLAVWLSASLGAAGIALSVGAGEVRPIMSNYLPVLDSVWFLCSLLLFGLAMLVKALIATIDLAALPRRVRDRPGQSLLLIAALTVLVAGGVLMLGHHQLDDRLEGHAYFEALFWGPGHIWQFALTSLLAVCWLELCEGSAIRRIRPRLLLLVAALPLALACAIATWSSPMSSDYTSAYTSLMRWASWPLPALVAWAMVPALARGNVAPGLRLSMVLFVVGLVIGTTIRAETTTVTAHYHGTIGAVTLAFMAYGLACLPRLGAVEVPRRLARLQLGLYGYGILLMIAGLSGAGLMGAPRKTPGALDLLWNVETVSRVFLGVGGVLATAGIIMYAVLVIPRLLPSTNVAVLSR